MGNPVLEYWERIQETYRDPGTGILQTRGYPVERLARDLEIAADVTADAFTPASDPVRRILLSGADAVRAG